MHLFETIRWGREASPAGLFRSSFTIPGDLLNDGRHRLELTVYAGAMADPLCLNQPVIFHVHDASDLRGFDHGAWPGVVRPHLQ